jgi:hypothetical protein
MPDLPTASTWFPTVDGLPGKSAYEIAVDEGFLGSEAQWLATLVGADGADGATGPTGAQGVQGDPGVAGSDGVVQAIVAGTGITVDATDPANPIVAASGGGGGGSQTGVGSALASGDIYLANDVSMSWGSSTISTTVTRFQMVYIDSEFISSGAAMTVLGVTGDTFSLSIYNFLGAGKPGTAFATATFATTPVGLVTASWAGGNKTFAPGIYFVSLRAGGINCSIADFSSSSEAPAKEVMLLLSDGFSTRAAGTTESLAVTVADVDLPGGSWSSGMDLTGLTMTNANTLQIQELAKIGLVKA